MEKILSEHELEVQRLELTLSIAKTQLTEALGRLEGSQDEIAAAKRELFDEASRPLGSLWGSQNFHELVELSQYISPITVQSAKYSQQAARAAALERLVLSPYFARVDFRFDGENQSERIYIGRASLTDEGSYEIYVYDWRAPIASVFYRFGAGPAFYEAPQGEVTGEVTLKRQFEIKNGALEYFFDSDVQIVDEFLRKMLSQNTSARMKTIVETIQKDQDIAIRDMESGLMMVQGVAGSGKTSIGLHRIAYLMYRGLKAKLSSHEIVVISPNALFEQYIANVLPELGEDNVTTSMFEELFERLTGNGEIQPRNALLEELICCEDAREKEVMRSKMAFKGSEAFKEVLDRLVDEIPKRWMEFDDVYYGGEIIADRQTLRSTLINDKRDEPLAMKLKRTERAILDAVHAKKRKRLNKLEEFVALNSAHMFEISELARLMSIRESTALLHSIRRFTHVDPTELYKRLFSDASALSRLTKGLALPANFCDIAEHTRQGLAADTLLYDDALAISYLSHKIFGGAQLSIRQVVVDEAQDYYPLHFELLRLLFPRARYTVLGDINQTIEKSEDMSFYDDVKRILAKDPATLITMNKSFRCTNEILAFSAGFLGRQLEIESFNRSGDAPVIRCAPDTEQLDEMLAGEIGLCRQRGYSSIALICKTQSDSEALYRRLKAKTEIKLVSERRVDDLSGAFIIPLFLCKGLEFDAVIIPDANRANYHTEYDKKLLYICSTRALHSLGLFCCGEISPLLPLDEKGVQHGV